MKGTCYRNFWSNCHLCAGPSLTVWFNQAWYVVEVATLYSKGWCLILFPPALNSFLRRSFSLVLKKCCFFFFFVPGTSFYHQVFKNKFGGRLWQIKIINKVTKFSLIIYLLTTIHVPGFIIAAECSFCVWFIIWLIWALWAPIVVNTGPGISSEC